MPKQVTLIVLVCIATISTAYAKIWRVNNNVGVTAGFATLQKAHDGAAPEDTLQPEGSPNNYGKEATFTYA